MSSRALRAGAAGGRTRAVRTPTPAAANVPAGPRPLDRFDVVLVLATLAGYLAVAVRATHGRPAVFSDTFRDMAYAQHILRGDVWRDPALAGQTWWYPPGHPWFIALISRLTGRGVVDLYATSALWLGWLNPVLVVVLVRTTWDRLAAVAVAPLAWLGSMWWLTHVAAPMPSVQGIALDLAALFAWHRCDRPGWRWPIATGTLAAAALWTHTLCGAVLLGAIVVHAVLGLALGEGAEVRARRLLHAALVTGIALVLAGAVPLHLMALPRRNPAPFTWFAPELHDLRYALHAHAPLLLPLGLLGLWRVWRATPRAAWLVALVFVGTVGQLAGYLGHDRGWPIPWLLPHEFQWHEQWALAIAAAVAVSWIASAIASRVHAPGRRQLARGAIAAGLVALAVGPALDDASLADAQFIHLDRAWATTLAASRWIDTHTPRDAVFATAPDAAYVLAALTGRRCVALPDGHMNPSVDAERRDRDLATLLTTEDAAEFVPLARAYGVGALLVQPQDRAAAAARYARWPMLARAPLPDSTLLLYRVTLPGR